MIADDIIKKSKNPAKTSPGPTGYNHYDGWKATLKKTPGNYKKNDKRITFCQEATWHANNSPGMKYPDVNLVSHILFLLASYLSGCLFRLDH